MVKFILSLMITVVSLTSACSLKEANQPGNRIINYEQLPSQTTEPPVHETNFPYQIEVVAEGLDVPWEMDIAKDGRLFLTERTGTIRVIVEDVLLSEPVISLVDVVHSQSESGLLGLVLDPNFDDNGYMYVYHTYQHDSRIYNRVLRLKESNNRAIIDKVLLDRLGGEVSGNHNGGRMKIGPDGYLYITVGEQYKPELAQDIHSYAGKILRIDLDGSIPANNPYPGSPVYSIGHRNVQGLTWHPDTKQLYASEHGQSAKDEINRIDKGANYGWPIIEGDETSNKHPEMRRPLIHSGGTTWAPSGMTFVSQGPWEGELLVANLRGNQVLRMTLSDDGLAIVKVEASLNEWGRIRNIFEAPDGILYVMTNNREDRKSVV